MNIIIDGLPKTVMVGGEEYQINYGFRTSILFELLMQDDGLTDGEKLWEALSLYYPVIPGDIQEAINAAVWFYTLGASEEDKKPKAQEDDDEEDEDVDVDGNSIQVENRIYSFEYDAPYIYAAFMEQYNIDLTEISEEEMHWWKFKALFQALNEKTQIMKIMGFRSVEITDKMTKEQKNYYRKMKKRYALPLSQHEKEKQEAIIEALQRGEDVSHLL